MTHERGRMLRLIDGPASEFERALLRSSEGDRSESGACDRALASLGLGAALVVAGASVPPGAAAGASTGAGAGASVAVGAGVGASAGAAASPGATAGGGALFAAKWIGVAVLGSAVVAGSARYVGHATARAVTDRTQNAAVTESRPASGRYGSPAGTAATPRDIPTPPSASPSAARRAVSAPPAAPEAPIAVQAAATTPARAAPIDSADVPDEIDTLRAIRLAVSQGDGAGALAKLDAFEAQHPRSAMTEELGVLRFDALVLAGRRAEASALADVFLRAHPRSVYGDHLRSALNSP